MMAKYLLPVLLALLAVGCLPLGPDDLAVELSSDRTTFAPGDTFEGTFTIRNTRASTATIQFHEMPRHGIELHDARDSVVLHSPGAYYQLMNELKLGSWGSESYDVEFVLPTDTGNYRARARMTGYSEPHFDLNIRVE
jgi:hypothetical protein